MPDTSRRYAGMDSSSPDVVRRGDVRRLIIKWQMNDVFTLESKRSLVLPQAPGVVVDGRSDSVIQPSSAEIRCEDRLVGFRCGMNQWQTEIELLKVSTNISQRLYP